MGRRKKKTSDIEKLLKKRTGKDSDSSDDEIDHDNNENRKSRAVSRVTRDYDIDVQLKEGESPNLILYRYRWVVLATYFMSSAATGSLQGSLSTNREIIFQAF